MGEGDAFAGERGRPCIVMAHGIGGTKDSGLLPFAQAFAEAGLDVLLFDYRCFGESTGEPRQLAWPPRHREDYRSAVEYARAYIGDPDRVVVWGTSWSGGHAVYAAAADRRIAAVIAQTPDLDGIATLNRLREYAGLGQQLRLTWLGLKDMLASRNGGPPEMIPTVAPPGHLGAMTTAESEPGMRAIAGPTWRNELTTRAVFAEWTNRAISKMDSVRCPILIQIADGDSVAPPAQARAAAWRAKGRVEVREYPCKHFDIYVGEWRERAIADQLRFLRRRLGAAEGRETAPVPSKA